MSSEKSDLEAPSASTKAPHEPEAPTTDAASAPSGTPKPTTPPVDTKAIEAPPAANAAVADAAGSPADDEGERSPTKDAAPPVSEGERSPTKDAAPPASEGERSPTKDAAPPASEGERSPTKDAAPLPSANEGDEPAPPAKTTSAGAPAVSPAGGTKPAVTEGPLAVLGALVTAVATRSRKLDAKLLRFDPNTDETADPLSAISVLAMFLATAVSVWMFVRFKYQPMQDLGHHVALAAVVADYGRPGSLYTSLYEPIDPFAANSLLYQLAGNLGRIVGVTRAVRFFMVFYLAGVPLATAYALRVFGRNIWGAVLSVPLSYNMVFVAGFANMLFGAPLMIMAIPLLHLAIKTRSWKRSAVAALTIALLFLGHAHLFLWTGFMLFLLTLGHFVYGLTQGPGLKKRFLHAAKSAGVAFLCVVPTLLLFGRWYSRTFGEGREQGNVMNATAGAENHFGAVFRSPHQMFATLVDTFELTTDDTDVQAILVLGLLAGMMMAVSRLGRLRQAPVLELVFVVSLMSYFVLPDGLSGHDVLTQRQPTIALWFAPAVFTPVSMRVSRLLRFLSVVAIGAITTFMLHSWHKNLLRFQTELVGLEEVMDKAPPRLRIHYVKLDPNSRFFTWRPFWHLEKIYMGDKLGQTPDTPGILSTSCIRYRAGVQIHRIVVHTYDWPNDSEIWKNFELVLVRSWHASPAQRAAAAQHGTLLHRAGDWELWRSNEATPP